MYLDVYFLNIIIGITVITQRSTEVQQNKIKRCEEYSITRESKKDSRTVLL